MRKVIFPDNVPVIDIWSPIQRHHTDQEWELMMKTHEAFVSIAPNREGIVAHGSGHYIFRDNPGLVISAIVKGYVQTIKDVEIKNRILSNALQTSIQFFINSKLADSVKEQ